MNKPTPQQETILSHLRSGNWVCGSAWLNGIKDDRARISSLNRGYMPSKGFRIIGEPCKGTACGKSRCPLYKRKAERLQAFELPNLTQTPAPIISYKD